MERLAHSPGVELPYTSHWSKLPVVPSDENSIRLAQAARPMASGRRKDEDWCRGTSEWSGESQRLAMRYTEVVDTMQNRIHSQGGFLPPPEPPPGPPLSSLASARDLCDSDSLALRFAEVQRELGLSR